MPLPSLATKPLKTLRFPALEVLAGSSPIQSSIAAYASLRPLAQGFEPTIAPSTLCTLLREPPPLAASHISQSPNHSAHSPIVGYTTTTLADASQAVSVGFTEVGGASGIMLTSIKPDVGTARCNGDIYIEILDGLGRTTATYYWYQNSRSNPDGWFNDDDDQIGEDVEDIVFAPGTGLWLNGIDEDTLTTAGAVFQADLGLTLADSSQMLGNPYAAPIGLAENIEVDVGETVRCNGDIYIEMLDSLGRTTETYYWYQNSRSNPDGWFNDDDDQIGEDVEDVVFPAGQGLWVNGIEDAEFNFTSPIPATNN